MKGIEELRLENDKLKQTNAALREQFRSCQAECAEVDQMLGKALGYPSAGPEVGGDHSTVCTGDHTPSSLATEAANAIAVLRAERDAALRCEAHALDVLRRVWETLGGLALPADPSLVPSPPVSGLVDADALELARQVVAERDGLRAACAAMEGALRMIQDRWTFNANQRHTHTWHDWADCQVVIHDALQSHTQPP